MNAYAAERIDVTVAVETAPPFGPALSRSSGVSTVVM